MGVEQQHGHGLAHNVGAPQHHTPLASGVNVVLLQQLHDAAGGTGLKYRLTDGKLSHVIGVETVHILARINGQQHLFLTEAPGQRQLHQNTVDVLPAVQLTDEVQQFLLGAGLWQGVLLAVITALLAVLALAVDVYPGGRIVPHDNDRKARSAPQLCRLLPGLFL